MPRKWQYVVIHHTAGPRDATVASIRKMHVDVRKWRDIGYHFVIERNGERGYLKAGRSTDIVGAHSGENWWNANALGIVVVGYFHPGSPQSEKLDTSSLLYRDIVGAVAHVMKKYNIPAKNIKGHREVHATACPGDYFPLKQLKADVAKALEG